MNKLFDTTLYISIIITLLLCVIAVVSGLLCSGTEEGKQMNRNSYIEDQHDIYVECMSYEYEQDFCLRLIGK